MSSCVVSSNHQHPLRSELHPVADLRQSEWTVNSLNSAVQPDGSIVQFTEEADQTTTYLLSLNQQEVQGPSDESQREFLDLIPSDILSEDLGAIFRDEGADVSLSQDGGRLWSEEELEAAETLLSCFNLTEEEALTFLDDIVPFQRNEHGSQTGLCECTFPSEMIDPGETEYRSEEVRGASMATERMLSDSECDAVRVLLSIWDVALLEGFYDPEVFGAI